MPQSFATLGDFFPDTDIRCRVHGCENTWNFSGEAALRDLAAGRRGRPERMCDDCWTRYQEIEDRELPCSTPDCPGSWTWTRLQQLEAEKRGFTTPPKGICETCRRKLDELRDVPIPCRVRDCTNTWLWSRRRQLQSPEAKPPPRLCTECAQILRELGDREVPCRVPGCSATWHWGRFQQLEHLRAGKRLEDPPSRMCPDCFALFRSLEDRQVPCKADGCTRTWTFTAYAQTEHSRRNGPEAPPPVRLCDDCYRFYQRSRPRQMRCMLSGCSGSWKYTREMQLDDWLHGRTRPPRRLCAECHQSVAETNDRQVPCIVNGCDGSWTYTALEQVRDARLGRTTAPKRRCPDCERFLAEHPTTTLECPHCGKDIRWSSYEQLLYARGAFAKPEMCADCAAQKLAVGRPAAKPIERPHHHVVRMPAAGRWHEDPALSAWPPHLTHDVIARVEQADLRIVAFGDDLTYSSPNTEEHWPAFLEAELNKQLDGQATVAVVNSGMPRTTSPQAVLRLPRDVKPFAPHLIVFSFTFADALLRTRSDRKGVWKELVSAEEAEQAMDTLCRRMRSPNTRLLFWTTNPILPHDRPGADDNPELRSWAAAQKTRKQHCLAEQTRICRRHRIPILDLRSRFEVNGPASARLWMLDWYRHNRNGARNIAVWMARHILQEGLIPVPKATTRRTGPPAGRGDAREAGTEGASAPEQQ